MMIRIRAAQDLGQALEHTGAWHPGATLNARTGMNPEDLKAGLWLAVEVHEAGTPLDAPPDLIYKFRREGV